MKYLSGMVSFENNFTEISWVLHKENQENTKISKYFCFKKCLLYSPTIFHVVKLTFMQTQLYYIFFKVFLSLNIFKVFLTQSIQL